MWELLKYKLSCAYHRNFANLLEMCMVCIYILCGIIAFELKSKMNYKLKSERKKSESSVQFHISQYLNADTGQEAFVLIYIFHEMEYFNLIRKY